MPLQNDGESKYPPPEIQARALLDPQLVQTWPPCSVCRVRHLVSNAAWEMAS